MKLLKNLLKGLVLITLIFGVLYFGLTYYFKQQSREPAPSAPPSKVTEEYNLLHEELAILEQKIQDLRKENRPFADEQEAVGDIRTKLAGLKQEMAAQLPAAAGQPDSAEVMRGVPRVGFLADAYQRVFVIGAGVLIILLFVFFIVRAMRARSAVPLRKASAQSGGERTPAPPRQRPKDKSSAAAPFDEKKADDARLKETLERFKSASAVIQKNETRELPIEAIKTEPQPHRAVREQPAEPKREPAQPQPDRAGTPVRDLGQIDRVFDLDRQGLSIEEISGRLHVDQDQVRLILRFKR